MTQLMATWSRANSKWQSMHLVSEYSVGLPPFHTGHLTILIHTGRCPLVPDDSLRHSHQTVLVQWFQWLQIFSNDGRTSRLLSPANLRYCRLYRRYKIDFVFVSRVTCSYPTLVELGCHPRGGQTWPRSSFRGPVCSVDQVSRGQFKSGWISWLCAHFKSYQVKLGDDPKAVLARRDVPR